VSVWRLAVATSVKGGSRLYALSQLRSLRGFRLARRFWFRTNRSRFLGPFRFHFSLYI